MTNKYSIGLLGFPLIPLFLYFLDLFYLGSGAAHFSEKFLSFFLRDGCVSSHNFYCYEYNRSVYFLSLFLSPFFIAFWFFSAKQEEFSFEGGKAFFKLVGKIALVILLFNFLSFMPVVLSEYPSKKQLAILNLHRDPVIFTLSIFWFLFFEFMVLGISLRYIFFIGRRFCANCN